MTSEYESKSYSCLLNFCKSGVNFLVWFGSRKLSHTTLIKGWRLRPVAVTFHHHIHFLKSFFISTLITSTFSWPFTVKLWTEVLILYLMWNSESFLRLLWIIWWHLVKLNIDITSLSQHWSAYLLLELLGNESFRPGSSYLQLLLAVCWLIYQAWGELLLTLWEIFEGFHAGSFVMGGVCVCVWMDMDIERTRMVISCLSLYLRQCWLDLDGSFEKLLTLPDWDSVSEEVDLDLHYVSKFEQSL